MLKICRSLAVAGFLAASLAPAALIAPAALADSSTPTAAPPAMATKLYQNEMDAIVKKDYNKFVVNGTPTFKAALTKDLFNSVCTQLSTVLPGYTSQYLQCVQAKGDNVYVWRVTLTVGQTIQAQLAAKQGKIDGFFLKPDTK
jgi:hypothetical protein